MAEYFLLVNLTGRGRKRDCGNNNCRQLTLKSVACICNNCYIFHKPFIGSSLNCGTFKKAVKLLPGKIKPFLRSQLLQFIRYNKFGIFMRFCIFIPGADILTDIASENSSFHFRFIFFRYCIFVLYR